MKEKFKNKKVIIASIIVGLIIIGIISAIAIYREYHELTDYEEQQQYLKKAKITAEKAEGIALTAVPGTVIHTSIDDGDWGKIFYEVYIRTDLNVREVKVNAKNGKIEKIEIETDYDGIGSNQNQNSQSNQVTTNNLISRTEAEQIALNKVAGSIIQLELDDENNMLYYEAIMKTDNDFQKVRIHALTGDVVRVGGSVETTIEANKVESLRALAKVSNSDAEQIALTKVNGTLLASELDDEHNRLVYKIKIQSNNHIHEVKVDAISGNVVGIDIND